MLRSKKIPISPVGSDWCHELSVICVPGITLLEGERPFVDTSSSWPVGCRCCGKKKAAGNFNLYGMIYGFLATMDLQVEAGGSRGERKRIWNLDVPSKFDDVVGNMIASGGLCNLERQRATGEHACRRAHIRSIPRSSRRKTGPGACASSVSSHPTSHLFCFLKFQ